MEKLIELPKIKNRCNTLEISEYLSKIASYYLDREVFFVYEIENEDPINNDAIEEDFIILEFCEKRDKFREFYLTCDELNTFIEQINTKIKSANILEIELKYSLINVPKDNLQNKKI